jgi:hypothetical protein
MHVRLKYSINNTFEAKGLVSNRCMHIAFSITHSYDFGRIRDRLSEKMDI